jgi:hypothetical protein
MTPGAHERRRLLLNEIGGTERGEPPSIPASRTLQEKEQMVGSIDPGQETLRAIQ